MGELGWSEQRRRVGRGGGVEGDGVGLGEEFVELHKLDADAAGAFFGDEGIEGDGAHFEGLETSGDGGADESESDDAGGFAAQFGADEGGAVPVAGFERGVGVGEVSGEGEEEGDGEFGGGDGVAAGGVEDDDAAL